MKNKKGYILLETIVSISIILILALSLYSILLICKDYKQAIEDKIELYEQGQEMSMQINRLIENSKGVLSVKSLDNKTITGNISSFVKIKSLKCKYRDEDNLTVKDRELSYKSNKKLFINTLNINGSSESGGYEIGDYVDYVSVRINDNKITILLSLVKNKEEYQTEIHSYIRKF